MEQIRQKQSTYTKPKLPKLTKDLPESPSDLGEFFIFKKKNYEGFNNHESITALLNLDSTFNNTRLWLYTDLCALMNLYSIVVIGLLIILIFIFRGILARYKQSKVVELAWYEWVFATTTVLLLSLLAAV